MRNLLIITFILLTNSFYGQWLPLSYQPTNLINDITCVNENLVFAAGNEGYLIKTMDGGATWLPKTTGTTLNLVKIRFTNADSGCALLQNKTLIKTTDGGTTWSVPFGTNILDFSMVSATIFYVTTIDGVLLKSTDSGLTFSTVYTTSFHEYIQFIDENVGFGGLNTLSRTTDGGLTWTSIGNCNGTPSSPANTQFHFLNENVGFKKDGNDIYKTTNGGTTYTLLSTVYHQVGKIIAASENIVWCITVDLLLNGQPNFTTRIETIGNDVFREDSSDQIFINCAFASPTVGYTSNYGFGMLFKNTTGTLLGTNNVAIIEKISIFPNPASEQINIALNEKSTEPFSVEIIDFLGKKVYSQSYNGVNTVSIDSKTFSSGIYLVTVSSQGKRETQKIIIK